MRTLPLLTYQNAKTVKGEALGYLTAILYLSPHKESGTNLCPKASKGCAAACLYTAGRGAFKSIQEARMRKTKLFLADRKAFAFRLVGEIGKARDKAERLGLKLCVRLNGTSDIAWENYGIMQAHPDVQFYDYTKISARILSKELPKNYHLTFSRSESNDAETAKVLANGGNASFVFGGEIPKTHAGWKIVNGDLHDLRFLDRKSAIVALKAKGRARKDLSGFVVKL